MIVIYVDVLTTAQNKEQFQSKLRHIVELAKQAPGCLKYEWLISPDNEERFIIFGEFETEESFAHYRKSNVVQMIGAELLPLLTQKPTFKHYQARVFEQG